MKKTLTLLFIVTFTPMTAFAIDGTIPKCKDGKINLVVINKDVVGCPGTGIGKHTYCLINPMFDQNSGRPETCYDSMGVLFKNTNDSYSFAKKASWGSMTYAVGYYKNKKYGTEPTKLAFVYKKNTVSHNCAEVFGSDLTCTVSESGDVDHKTYTLTISDNP